MNMNYKLIACDLDGTLLDDYNNLGERNARAIKKIANAGIHFAVVTGRTFYEIPKEIRELNQIDYIIYSDGAAAVNKNSRTFLFEKYFTAELTGRLFELLNSFDTMTELYEKGRPVADAKKINEASLAYYNIDRNYRPVILATRTGDNNFEKRARESESTEIINVFFKDLRQREACLKELDKIKAVTVTASMDNNLEIMPYGISKGNALKKLCDMLAIPMESVIAAGDSQNDLTMLNKAGLPLAPSNSCEAVKRKVKHVICSNNDGVAQYICKNILDL